MLSWLTKLLAPPSDIPDALWHLTLTDYPFLGNRPNEAQARLRFLTMQFLAQKQFSGAHGLLITDRMAVCIATQACLPILNLGLTAYDDFKGIVVHSGAMVARRRVVDAAGVHHSYKEALAGEATEGGPVTLSWQDVAASDEHFARGYNLVIHEFVHKLDMGDGAANGCPFLPTRAARTQWQSAMQASYQLFLEQVAMAERFGAEMPWLDAYGSTSPAEFFSVASEAYFVNPSRFALEFPDLNRLFGSYF